MKVAVINFSGNVGKTTVARHLLAPRIEGAEVIAVESINADDGQTQALRGRQFGELQEYLQTVDNVVVDIGASNVEELLSLMRKYRGSHEDFDYFVIPTVPALKQQQDTFATLAELTRIGIPASKLKVVFNQVEDDARVSETFDTLLAFIDENPPAQVNTLCRLGANEIYERVKAADTGLAELASDETDYKALIARARDTAEARLGAEARDPAARVGRRSRARRVLRGAGPHVMPADRSTTAREALVAELIGDMAKLLDRVDTVAPAIHEARRGMTAAARELAAGVAPFKAHMDDIAVETKKTAVEHIVSRTNSASAKPIRMQTRAMRDLSKAIVDEQVGPPLRQLAGELDRLVEHARRPWWEDWATYAATAMVSAIGSAMLVLYVVHG